MARVSVADRTPAAPSASAHAMLPGDVVFEERAVEAERHAEIERRRDRVRRQSAPTRGSWLPHHERGLRHRRFEISDANVANRVVALEELNAHGSVHLRLNDGIESVERCHEAV